MSDDKKRRFKFKFGGGDFDLWPLFWVVFMLLCVDASAGPYAGYDLLDAVINYLMSR